MDGGRVRPHRNGRGIGPDLQHRTPLRMYAVRGGIVRAGEDQPGVLDEVGAWHDGWYGLFIFVYHKFDLTINAH